jgi:hypothetical protein
VVASRRKPHFVSPSASSVSIAITGIAQPVVADVSASASGCTTAGSTRTCIIHLEAPAGKDTFTATLYAGANATGNVLGQGSVIQVIGNGQPFTLTIGLTGTSATIIISAAQVQFTTGVPASTAVTVEAFDAGGNEIVGSYTYPIALVDSDSTGTFTISPTTLTNSSTQVTLQYSGGTAATEATISATETGVPAASVVAQNVFAEPPGSSPAPSPGLTATPGPMATATPTGPTPTMSPVSTSNIVLTPAYTSIGTIGTTSGTITIDGPASTNYAAMTATSSDTSVATVTLAADGHSFTVTSAGVGSATITVVPSDGSAGPGYESVYVEETVIAPQARGGRK